MAAIRLCVYCGSSNNVDQVFIDFAKTLGMAFAERSIELVFGGGRPGLMGAMADACLAAGGEVTGIIPDFLDKIEVGHTGTNLTIVDSMHVRKSEMAKNADGFLVLPGGFGTLDEFFEILTWKQIGLHNKPIIIVDVNGYWQPLHALLNHLIKERFALPKAENLWQVASDLKEVFALIDNFITYKIDNLYGRND